jgi:hypothetical protein
MRCWILDDHTCLILLKFEDDFKKKINIMRQYRDRYISDKNHRETSLISWNYPLSIFQSELWYINDEQNFVLGLKHKLSAHFFIVACLCTIVTFKGCRVDLNFKNEKLFANIYPCLVSPQTGLFWALIWLTTGTSRKLYTGTNLE